MVWLQKATTPETTGSDFAQAKEPELWQTEILTNSSGKSIIKAK